MFDGFEVVPAVDIQDGKAVQLVGGERGTETNYGSPAEAARRWVAEGARSLHIVDLDGAFEGERRNAAAVDAILDTVEVPIQLGGGIRSVDDATRRLKAGIDRVVLGTLAVERPDAVQEIATEYPNGVVVSLDTAEGEVVIEGWTEGTGLDPVEAARRYAELGAAGILYTDVDVEGKQTGIRAEPIRRLATTVDIPVIASGGVASVEDVLAVREAGAAACVVGTALYEGAFTLTEARAALDDRA
ncbi:MAG: 1-(5-phosphoribosyl)-5-[(5-phosphoribosylamino)methylideneamino]imidazole-4-carboxamide isomerase [Halobacteriaceae archaeon]